MQQTSSSTTSPSLFDCLKLLNGERDEQKLAGLLLATKFCHVGDTDSVFKVYNAVGNRFLSRLLMTGMGKGADNGGSAKSKEERDAFLKLSITVLSSFCRVPEIAASKEMVDKVHDISEIISNSLDETIIEECYEFLLLVATASQNGKNSFYEPGVMEMLASHVSIAKDGAQSLELAIRLLQLLFNNLPIDAINEENVSGLSYMVDAVARQFDVLHNALKFDALHLLTLLLSPKNSILHNALRLMPSENWTSHIRIGIAAVLQNRVVSEEKLQALLLAESTMSIVGEDWLAKHMEDDNLIQMSNDKYILLVLETARVEVAVLLNEIAYAKYEAGKSAATDESILLKQRSLAVTFSLLEKIIRLISNASGVEGGLISESTLMKVIGGLNETINLVFDFLQDSKDHGQCKGDDILAAVRIIGSYLAETPFACKEKTQNLLAYMLSVEGVDEASPFYSICFLLPLLCQITVEKEGCKLLISSGAHKIIVECLIKMIGSEGTMVESHGTMLLACETILNILLKIKELRMHVDQLQIVHLLCALALWTENSSDSTAIMMVACICALIFDLTSEEALLSLPSLDRGILERLSQVIAFSLTQAEEMSYDVGDHLHLQQIVTSGYHRWADRFPVVKRTVDASMQTK